MMLRGLSGSLRTAVTSARFASSAPPRVSAAAAATVPAADAGRVPYIVLVLPGPPPAAATVPTLLQPRVVIYDGVCHLCHQGVKWVIKADKHRKIKFCCLQSKAAEPYMRWCGVEREDVLRRFLFIEGPEACYEGSTAALKVASYLPFPYSALSALLIVPGPLREAVYDYVAKRRYDWFGREEECLITQEKEMLERFIDRDEFLSNGDDKGSFTL